MAEYIVCLGKAEHYQGSDEVVLVHPPVGEELGREIGKKALAPRTIDVEEFTPGCTMISLPGWKKMQDGAKDVLLMAQGVASVLRAEGHHVDFFTTTIRFDAHDEALKLHETMQAVKEDAEIARAA